MEYYKEISEDVYITLGINPFSWSFILDVDCKFNCYIKYFAISVLCFYFTYSKYKDE